MLLGTGSQLHQLPQGIFVTSFLTTPFYKSVTSLHTGGNILDLILTNSDDYVRNLAIHSSGHLVISDHFTLTFHLSTPLPSYSRYMPKYVYDYPKSKLRIFVIKFNLQNHSMSLDLFQTLLVIVTQRSTTTYGHFPTAAPLLPLSSSTQLVLLQTWKRQTCLTHSFTQCTNLASAIPLFHPVLSPP